MHLEESLTNSKAEILKLRSALTSSEDKIHLLDHQLEELNTKFSEEVQIRDETLNKQNSELDSKANTIAMLTQQLYNTKVRLRNELQAKTTATAALSHAASSGVCVCPHCHVHRKNKPAVTGDRYYALGGDGGVVPVGLGADYQMSPSIATGAGSSRSRVSRIQRRHFRNSSSPVSQDVRNLSQSESEDGYFSPSTCNWWRWSDSTSIANNNMENSKNVSYITRNVEHQTEIGFGIKNTIMIGISDY